MVARDTRDTRNERLLRAHLRSHPDDADRYCYYDDELRPIAGMGLAASVRFASSSIPLGCPVFTQSDRPRYHFGMRTMSVRLPDDVHARLADMAKARHMSVNAAIAQAAEQWITTQAREQLVQAAVDRVFDEDADLFDRLADG